MSFALKVKEELCNVKNTNSIEDFAELKAMLRFGSEISMSSEGLKLSFSSTSLTIIRHFLSLLKKFHDVKNHLESRIIKQFEMKKTYTIYIDDQVDVICESYHLLTEDTFGIAEIESEDIMRKAFLRGAFICKGSVNNPVKGNYHLEIKSLTETEAVYIQRLMNAYDLNAKMTKRRNHIIVYIKDVGLICDFLRIIGTVDAVFEIEEVLILRDVTQSVNRQMIIQIANEEKAMLAAKDQMGYIQYLEYNYPVEKLDPKLLRLMNVRKKHPEDSLTELIEVYKNEYDEKITKSGLSHRFRKIKEIAINYRKSRRES